ncbi:GHKL domain-containing protein [Parabacteroides sp. 52]|uniref:sensor histidine kinase n=1 Tax=unclassified Parabacteroides TaxID=2649774 RepID=UPI0013CFE7B1|nr:MULTISPECIES: ATP-binding protein [unclassified Parabacteroides]MDH6533681.1 two-component system NtrC family sensor kinase [Parabacteroides sp. PM5-20]NDV54434.1 GHKL domain-containing protein [Parabacteroides sp. 52]
MADFNVKEIQQLKLKIQIAEKSLLVGVVATGFAIYYDTFFGPLVLVLIILLIVRSRWKKKLKQKEYLAKIVEERTIELRVQRDQVMQESEKLSNALDALAEAQDELVRNERLATVGQLTKGLVDRILNPLNYINNFASLSVDLVAELKKNITDEQAVMTKELYVDSVEILEMITNNLQKITEHGANTVRIVKAMEELLKDHKGNFTAADINNLCKVNLDVVTKLYDKEIEEKQIELTFEGLALPLMIDINIEQMSKVLLNIYRNALYALLKKAEKETYSPKLQVRVRREGQFIVIYIHDNGIGIEESIKNRVFEPFFTTKPTSEASGIGLYLSREVVLNHKGILTVTSEKNNFTEFEVKVPIHQNIEIKEASDESE